MYRKYIKYSLDFLLSVVLFLIALPVFLLAFVLLLIANRGTVFFLQDRPGKDEKIFKIIKFKTMNDLKDANGNLLPDEKRLTPIGKFIRKTSIDEIPQLLNVIKGDMSLIGPRPLLVEYLSLYSEKQRKRHDVKPGITGWAQVNGRNAISWEEKFNLDVYYVENLSFWLDLKIILLTIKKVIFSENISSTTSVTMEKFKG